MTTFLHDLPDEPQDDDSADIETVTLPDFPLPKVTMQSPTLEVRNVIRGSYIHRVMLANGYKEVQS